MKNKINTLDIVTSYSPLGSAATYNRVLSLVNTLSEKYSINIHMLVLEQDISHVKKIIKPIHANFILLKQYNYSKTNFIKRSFFELKYSIKLFLSQKKTNASNVIITIPFMFLVFFWIFKSKKTNVILDIRDLSWEYIPNNNLKQKSIKKMLRFIMITSIKRYKKISVTNKYEYKYLEKYRIKNKLLISNGISIDKFNILSKITNSLEDKKLIITYAGNIGIAQNLTTMIDAVSKIDGIEFNIAGIGVEYNYLLNYIHTNNIKNINMLGKIDFNDLVNMYSRSHILYAQLSSGYSTAVPSKLYEYLSTGKDILYGGKGASIDMLNEFEGTTIVDPDNYIDLCSALRNLKGKCFNIHTKNRDAIYSKYIRENSVKLMLLNYL